MSFHKFVTLGIPLLLCNLASIGYTPLNSFPLCCRVVSKTPGLLQNDRDTPPKESRLFVTGRLRRKAPEIPATDAREDSAVRTILGNRWMPLTGRRPSAVKPEARNKRTAFPNPRSRGKFATRSADSGWPSRGRRWGLSQPETALGVQNGRQWHGLARLVAGNARAIGEIDGAMRGGCGFSSPAPARRQCVP